MCREQKEKKEAKDRYWQVSALVRSLSRPAFSLCLLPLLSPIHQLHVQGKTDQAKADLSRLAEIRAKREAAAARRKAEADGECNHIGHARNTRLKIRVLVRRESQGIGGRQGRAVFQSQTLEGQGSVDFLVCCALSSSDCTIYLQRRRFRYDNGWEESREQKENSCCNTFIDTRKDCAI